MAIIVTPDTTTAATPNFFSTKETVVPTFLPKNISDIDYCTCLRQCVPNLLAFTDEVGTDSYKNDFYRMFMNIISGGSVVLKIVASDGTETTVTDNTYGELVTVSGNYFTYRFDFYDIWSNLGYDVYYFTLQNLNGDSVVIQEEVSPKFRLMKYSPQAANGTIRIETQQRGILKHNKRYTDNSLLGAVGVNQQIRLKGALTYSGEIVENSELQLNNANRTLYQIKDQVLPEYNLRINLASAPQIVQVLFDYLFANEVKVSDYNLYNYVIDPANLSAKAYRSIPLKKVSTSFNASSKQTRKSFDFKMEYANKNVYKLNV